MIYVLISAILFVVAFIVFENRHAIVKNFYLNRRASEVMKTIPGPSAIPILGSAYQFKLKVEDFSYQVEDWGRRLVLEQPAEKSGGLFSIWIGPIPIVAAILPEAIKVILESNSLITKPSQYNILGRFLGWGLLLSTGERWHSRRKLLTPAFHFNILKGYFDIFAEQGEVLVNSMDAYADSNEIIDVFPMIKRCGLDIIGETAMGIRLGTQVNENYEYIGAINRIQQIIWDYQRFPWLWTRPVWWLSGYEAEFDSLCEWTMAFSRKVIAARKEMLEEDGVLDQPNITEEQIRKCKYALLDLLLLMQKANALTDEDVRMEIDTFMFEGSDTNSSNIGFTLWFLGQHEDEQAKLHAELDSIFGNDKERPPTEDDIRAMPHLDRCIKESLRMLPPVPIIARTLTSDIEISGRILPEGMTVVVTPLGAHRDSRHWERPEEYWPDHFLPEKQAARDPYAFIPFSAGPRNCIGQRFAMLEAKSILAQIFRRFRVETIERWPGNRPLPEIILKPSNGFRVRLFRR